jgi:hypothetical protein
MYKRSAAALLAFFSAALAASPLGAVAGEKGRFEGHAVLEVTKFTEYKAMEGHPMKSVSMGEMDGLMFYNGGTVALNRLLERAHYHVVFVGDGGGGGYCTLLGGTGPFTGIKGKGKFNVVFVTDRVSWDDMEWEWETP